MKKFFVIFFTFGILFSSSSQESLIQNKMNSNLKISSDLSNKSSKRSFDWQHGWRLNLNYGITKFTGDVTQYDHYPAYQEQIDFRELSSAVSLGITKKVNSLYSISLEYLNGNFKGLRRANEYLGLDVYDNYNNYSGNGDKFSTSFNEFDLLVNLNLSNAFSFFQKNRSSQVLRYYAKFGMGYNVFNSVRTNLFSDTYIYSFGYEDEGSNDAESSFGTNKKPFFEQTKETVYVLGLRGEYRLNEKMCLFIDYTNRIGQGDKWDASIMSTQNPKDKFSFLSIGFVYDLSDSKESDWTSPLDMLKQDVGVLKADISGFTDDLDSDGVADAFDKDLNTPFGVPVDGSGVPLDVDMDNVPDYMDVDPFSNRGAIVDVNGVEYDSDNDGVPNSKDLESNTPMGVIVDRYGIGLGSVSKYSGGYLPSVYFESGQSVVHSSNEKKLATIALVLKNNPKMRLRINGHTDDIGDAKLNKELGLQRAKAVMFYLIQNYNIKQSRFEIYSKGEEDPLRINRSLLSHENEKYDQKTSDNLINRRVDFEIIF